MAGMRSTVTKNPLKSPTASPISRLTAIAQGRREFSLY